MKGLDKLTSIRLAEALTQKDAVPNEVITDALYAQDRHGESFVESLVGSGNITEWDLAKLVVEQFQVPFLMAGNYDVGDEAKTSIPKELLFKHLIVPLDRFGDILTLAMPILAPFEVLMALRKQTGCDVFPYVGLISENKRVLGEMFSDFFEWTKEEEKRREAARTKRGPQGSRGAGGSEAAKGAEADWMNIFDVADAEVRHSLHDE